MQVKMFWATDCNEGYHTQWITCLKNYTYSVGKIIENNSSIMYQPLKLFNEFCQRKDIKHYLICFANGIQVCAEKVKDLNIPLHTLEEMKQYSYTNMNYRCYQLEVLENEWPCLNSYSYKPYFVCMANTIVTSMQFCRYYLVQQECIRSTVGSACGQTAADAYEMWLFSDMDVQDCQINPINYVEILCCKFSNIVGISFLIFIILYD
ncbi:hypothetical protein CHS0354_014052 [Potamilus streckersoni]|uniref:DUF19 domain-containing protein n=1 Tax=Potamilus streckersoni TaxID=2493646 RepID=A0AAE0VQH1_9BIVA|nr:hypothetical protein CHS0354_014052 [Potamilus streckersoni]